MPDISQLSAQLSHSKVSNRSKAAEQLARLGMEARGAAVPLVRAVADEDESVREWAAAALEELGAPSPEDATALASLLNANQTDTAYWAATLLGRLEDKAAGAVPAITAALQQSPHRAVRERAAWALGQIGVSTPTTVDALRQAAAEEPRLARLARLAQAALQRLTGPERD